MTLSDLYLISPEISTVILACLVLLAGLAGSTKRYLGLLVILGLFIPLIFSLFLWSDLDTGKLTSEGILAKTIVVDHLSIFFKLIIIGSIFTIVLISESYLRQTKDLESEYFALILFSGSGMMLLGSCTELITLYVALELTALPLAALAAIIPVSKSAESGLKFLIISGVSSALLLYGMVLIYGFTGTTVFSEMGVSIAEIGFSNGIPFGSYLLLLGVILMIAGFGFKIAAFPFHMWAPDVYEGAPTPITAFLSVASKTAGFAVILRFFYLAFPITELSMDWSSLFAVIAALSMTFGNLLAIAQDNIKRMLAYSTIAHSGYIMVGIAAVSSSMDNQVGIEGPTGILFYLAGYAVTNLAAFSVVIAVSKGLDRYKINDFKGLARKSPLIAIVLILSMMSLTGVPPTVGFMAKIYVFYSAVNADLVWLAIVGGLNSVLSAYYYMRVVKVMVLEEPTNDQPVKPNLSLNLAFTLTSCSILFFGLYPAPIIEIARQAASVLS